MMAKIDISTYIPVFGADLNLKKVCSVGGGGRPRAPYMYKPSWLLM